MSGKNKDNSEGNEQKLHDRERMCGLYLCIESDSYKVAREVHELIYCIHGPDKNLELG